MKKNILIMTALLALASLAGCRTPAIQPVDTFINKTAGPELEYYWKHDLETEKKFVKDKDGLKARMLNLKTMRQLINEAQKNEN